MAISYLYGSRLKVVNIQSCLLAILTSMLVYLPSLNQAQTYNPNLLPLGDKESLMANAGTGGLGSIGAVYYNPAALTEVQGNSVSLSGSAYLQFKFSAKPVANFFGTDLDYSGTGYESIPTSLIVARPIKKWYVAYSILIPMSFRFEGPTDWYVPLGEQNLKLKMFQNYEESVFMIGVTAARKLGNGWSGGVSFYGQSYSYLSSIDLRGNIEENPSVILIESNRISRNPFNFLVIGGIHKRWDKWGLGFRAQAPALYLLGKGSYYSYSYSNFAGPDAISTDEINIESIRADFKTPVDLRLGTVYHPHSKWVLALDVSWRFALEYEIYSSPELQAHESLKGNYRVNTGFEFRWKDNKVLYGGASYTPTTLKETESNFGEDYWSILAGGKLITKYLESSIGMFYSIGKGEGSLSVGEGSTAHSYEYIGIVLGTNYKF